MGSFIGAAEFGPESAVTPLKTHSKDKESEETARYPAAHRKPFLHCVACVLELWRRLPRTRRRVVPIV